MAYPPEIDLRRHAAQTRCRMVRWGLLIIVVVGLGLIALIYGGTAAGIGAICLLAALVPVVIVVAILALLQYIVRRSGRDA